MYELLYIIPYPFTEKDVPSIREKVTKLIEGFGGKIVKEENLGHKKFAYPIKKVHRGYYICCEFDLESENVTALEEKLKRTPEILRFLITKKPLPPKAKVEKVKKEEKIDLEEFSKRIEKLLEE